LSTSSLKFKQLGVDDGEQAAIEKEMFKTKQYFVII